MRVESGCLPEITARSFTDLALSARRVTRMVESSASRFTDT